MRLADLLKESLDVDNQDAWENERTPTPIRCFAVRLQSYGALKYTYSAWQRDPKKCLKCGFTRWK